MRGLRAGHPGVGELQPRHLPVHALRRRASLHGRAHQQDQAPQARPVGGRAGHEDEGGKIDDLSYTYFDLINHAICPQVGNLNSKLKYEQWVPPSYRRVDKVTEY